ncbi:unnamed protein product [Chrysodeixis includens]|uniref:Uncharacterized protein n=1 Tax=Chrysodeixis includens TaxID=689277 RepID=A0A9P0FV66_CHRIL|nr:unnamed protein product [Chrysodeixis includens]
MKILVLKIIVIGILPHSTLQNCPEEVTDDGISVTWHQTPAANNVESDPLCYRNDTLITRNCSNIGWTPALDEIPPCLKVVKYFDLTTCPPGYFKISENNNDYCYQIAEPSAWDHPCFSSGGATVITDLSSEEVDYLLKSLSATNTSRYFWLPAHRQKVFNPVVWSIPGPKRGRRVAPSKSLPLYASFTKNCLLLDTQLRVLTTEVCSAHYPSLCFYINDLHYPTKCPDGYHSFRFKLDSGTCFGIEKSDISMPFNDFLYEKCKNPMTNGKYDLTRFIFKKIAELYKLPDDVWCWFRSPPVYKISDEIEYTDGNNSYNKIIHLEGVINNVGVLSLKDSSELLTCMACEASVMYWETEFMFEYNEEKNKIYLTVYYPSGLWKYDNNDIGIQCFSDAKGFVRVVDINDSPLFEINSDSIEQNETALGQVEKIVYVIDLVTDSSAQYWCEGHTVDFSIIATNKIIANPKGNKVHVFALVIKLYVQPDEVKEFPTLTTLMQTVTDLFSAKKVLLMDIFDYFLQDMMILMHLHVDVVEIHDDKALNIQETFNILMRKAELLPNYNITFVNMSSSVYCLPTTSEDVITLDWETTLIGHITAPKQFCLQANGLPVKRHCLGSYLLGGRWGDVEGHCDNTYEPSDTTTFLYNIVKRQMPNIYISRFLIDGLNFVLGDTDIIIPADIYYLSMSLQQILDVAHENATSVDTGDIENIAWVVDRMMILDYQYLRLAQTLNSTNVILDSVSDIIELIAQRSINESTELSNVAYQLAVKPQFIVQISYPDYNNITGVALIKTSDSNNFTDMLIQPLYKNTSLEDVLTMENLEIATWVPEQLLNTIQRINNGTQENNNTTEKHHIIITIFHNNAIFQELVTNKHEVNSRIIGVTIPDYFSNLEYPIPLIFKQMNHSMRDSFCGYWDFQPQQVDHIPGSWKKKGCYIVKVISDTTVCECYHLTHFGQLVTIPKTVSGQEDNVRDKNHATALNMITLIGSFLSLLGITGIWITALVFGNWRKKAGTKVLLQLSTAIALPLVFILVFNLDVSIFIQVDKMYVVAENKRPACIVMGSMLHFSILASFMWMLITAILQFIRYVRVLGVRRPARFMFKFTLIGWGIPTIPVILTLALDAQTYIPSSSMIKRICYPNGYYLILGVLVPVCVILAINIILFILVLHAISRGSDQKIKTTDMDLISAQLRVSIFLFFLLGLTWIFGIFSFSNHLLWSYLFCLTSTLQGFVLFIYFVICDPNTRCLWVTLMKPQFVSSSSRNSITSISTG